jgi:dTDP-4-dehydrorhamnose 3,5-epimerase
MQVERTKIPGLLVITPRLFQDDRGHFVEAYHDLKYREAGIPETFVQDNLSRSKKGTLRGLHFQNPQPQGKLLWVVRGEIFDAVVDLRRSSPTFGQSWWIELGDSNPKQIYVPPGLAHGFCVTSEQADVLYKCTDRYHPEGEKSLLWNDPALGIPWPITEPLLSPKDRDGKPLSECELYD